MLYSCYFSEAHNDFSYAFFLFYTLILQYGNQFFFFFVPHFVFYFYGLFSVQESKLIMALCSLHFSNQNVYPNTNTSYKPFTIFVYPLSPQTCILYGIYFIRCLLFNPNFRNESIMKQTFKG